MRKAKWILYTVLILGSIWVCGMGYRQVADEPSETLPDLSTWLTKQEIKVLMRYHGADGMMVTPDAAYIMRDSKWIKVFKKTG